MKPSLEQLKHAQANDLAAAEYWERHAATYRASAAQFCAEIDAEEEREAKAKAWPQVGDKIFVLAGGCVIEALYWDNFQEHLGMGLLFRTRAEAELVRDFLRSRPRGWLLAMAKLGNPVASGGGGACSGYFWNNDKWNALTEDERAALLGQG